jgi:signal transduction histidine kinase
LSSPFGELNENQEEMLEAARRAVDVADADVRRLKKLIEFDRGAVPIMVQPSNVRELLRPPLAIAEARAAAGHVQLDTRIPDTLRRAIVDPVHAQEALTSILLDTVSRAPAGSDVTVRAFDDVGDRPPPASARYVRIDIAHAHAVTNDAPRDASLELRLARRLIEAQRGSVHTAPGLVTIELPSEGL